MIIDKLTALIKWEVNAKELRTFSAQSKGVFDSVSKLAKRASLAGAALVTLGSIVANNTAKNVKLAESVGLSADAYLAWEGVLAHVGFEGEKVVDLVEEMNNKLGEMSGLGKMTAVEESLKQLGIKFKDIKNIAPEEQFLTILEAAKSLENEQIAASAADMLLGGEANRVIGLLRSYEGSVKDILESHRALNFMTDRGIAGAQALSMAFDNIKVSGKSLLGEFMGRMGQELGPLIAQWMDWVRANRELISQRLDDVVRNISEAMRWLVWAGEKVKGVIDSLGGFGNTIKLLIGTVAAWKAAGLLTSLSAVLSTMKGLSLATGGFKSILGALLKMPLVALFVAAGFAIEDLIVYLQGGESFFGKWSEHLIPQVEESFLSLFGVIDEGMTDLEKEEAIGNFRMSFLDTIDAIGNGYDWLVDKVSLAIGEIIDFHKDWFQLFVDGFDWIREAASNVFSFLIDDATQLIEKVAPVIDAVIEKIKMVFRSFTGFLREIPIVGNLVADMSESPFTFATAGLSGAVATPSVSNITNRASNQNVNVNAPITVNAPAGADTTAIARQVNQQLASQVSSAVKNLNTGIKR